MRDASEGRRLLLLRAACAEATEPAVQPSAVARRAHGRRHKHAEAAKAAAHLGLDDFTAFVQQRATERERPNANIHPDQKPGGPHDSP